MTLDLLELGTLAFVAYMCYSLGWFRGVEKGEERWRDMAYFFMDLFHQEVEHKEYIETIHLGDGDFDEHTKTRWE